MYDLIECEAGNKIFDTGLKDATNGTFSPSLDFSSFIILILSQYQDECKQLDKK